MKTNERINLFDEFLPVSTEEWEKQILIDLKGQDYHKKLTWQSIEQILLDPYYRAEDLKEINLNYNNGVLFEGKVNNRWKIGHHINDADTTAINDEIKKFSSAGADAFSINAKFINNADKLSEVFKDINPENFYLTFYNANCNRFLRGILNEFFVLHNVDSVCVNGCLNHDPLTKVVKTGYFIETEKAISKRITELFDSVSAILPRFKALSIDGIFYQEAGANAVQELAIVFSLLVEYIDWLTEEGLLFENIISYFQLRFGIGSSYFTEIAKLRAARLFWDRLLKNYNKNLNVLPEIYVETSAWNMGIYDAYTNVLRSTTEAMSAIIGGADLITIKPFNSIYTQSDDFSKRLALNIQMLLRHEVNLDKVADPSAGSYFIENYTETLFNHSWKLFQEIENKGGFVSCVKKNIIQEMIEKTNQEREKMIATKKESILGINLYPDPDEKMINKLDYRLFMKENDTAGSFKTIETKRKAEVFEYLRLQTESFIEKGGKKPVIFMLPYGNPGMASARQIFSRNFFGVAGYRIIENIRFNDISDGVKAAIKADSDVVVLCSSDDEYWVYAKQICNEIKMQNKNIRIVVAGNPANSNELIQAGIDDFIHIKSNLLECLTIYQKLFHIIID